MSKQPVVEAIRSELERMQSMAFNTSAFTEGWRAAVAHVDGKLKNMERELAVLPDTEHIWCMTINERVPMEKCVTNCGAPELRPRCWAAKGIADSFREPEPDPERPRANPTGMEMA